MSTVDLFAARLVSYCPITDKIDVANLTTLTSYGKQVALLVHKKKRLASVRLPYIHQGEHVKKLIVAAVFMWMAFAGTSTQAAVYYFTPPQPDLQDLDHYDYKSWGIDWTQHVGERITGATLTFRNIWDWTQEWNDRLYIHLLDNPRLGVRTYFDDQRGGDNWSGRGPHITTWTDPYGGRPRNFDLVVTLNASTLDYLNQFAMDGRFGFGFDPDCHYYNDGVSLQITTEDKAAPTPEPTTMALFGLGLAGLGVVRRMKSK